LTEVLSLEKYGPNATVQQGELAKVRGLPVKVMDMERQNAIYLHRAIYDKTYVLL